MKSIRRIQTAIKHSVISEKAQNLRDQQNILTMVVDKSTNKVELLQAVRQAFNQDVVSINIVNVKGKTKNRGNRKGRRSDYKKAYIKFASLESLDVEGSVE